LLWVKVISFPFLITLILEKILKVWLHSPVGISITILKESSSHSTLSSSKNAKQFSAQEVAKKPTTFKPQNTKTFMIDIKTSHFIKNHNHFS
jgi:hypothetical protein